MLKKYHRRKEQRIENYKESENIRESQVSEDGDRMEQVAAIACVIIDGISEALNSRLIMIRNYCHCTL